MKKFTLKKFDDHLCFIDCIARSEDEAVTELKRIWGGGEWKVIRVSDELAMGVNPVFTVINI